MQMVYRLPACRSTVDDQAIAAVAEAVGLGQAIRHAHQPAHQRFLRRCQVRDTRNMQLRDHDQMGGRLRMDVGKGERLRIFMRTCGGDFSIHDAAEEAGRRHG